MLFSAQKISRWKKIEEIIAGLQLTHHPPSSRASRVEQRGCKEEQRPSLVLVSGNTKMAENKMAGVLAT